FDVFAGKKSAQIREILISESAWEEMTCLFAPSLDKVDAPSTCATRNLYSSDTITPDYFPSPEYE
ncbi:MAG: hypothetical protein E6992_12880, partial [Escherichia coli]|nr:hypothetical protein [Escherichia coli]